MKRLFSRVVAFLIDMLICSFIILFLSTSNLFNPLNDKVNERYQDYYNEVETYQNLDGYFERMFADEKLENRELEIINKDYDSYLEIFEDIKLDEKISDEEILELKEKIDIKYVEVVNSLGYKINRLLRYQVIISIIVYLLYFTILEVVFKGQTIGKKITRVRIVNKDNNGNVPFWKYGLRAFLACEIIFSILEVVLVMSLKEKAYIQVEYWVSNAKYIYEMVFLASMIVRDDQRSIHDLLFGTKVIKIDKDGKEIDDILFKELDTEEEVEIKDIVSKKNTKKKKEVVEAIKVNDKKRINKSH